MALDFHPVDQATVVESKVLLTSQDKWKSWIGQIQFEATNAFVWEYINPNAKPEPPKLVEPPRPLLSSFKEGATLMSELTLGQREDFKWETNQWRTDYAQWQSKVSSITAIGKHIFKTLPAKSHPYLDDITTVHGMLVELQSRFQPTDRARQLEITKRYQDLRKGPKATTVINWIESWMSVHKEATSLNLPEAHKERPLFAFLAAIEGLDPVWSANTQQALNHTLLIKPEDLPTMTQLATEYKSHRVIESLKQKTTGVTRGALVTLQGQTPNGQSSNRKPKCLCGDNHFFSECQYVVKELKDDKWDKHKQKMVDEKIKEAEKDNTKIFEAIKKGRQYYKDKAKRKGSSNSNSHVTVEEEPLALIVHSALGEYVHTSMKQHTLPDGDSVHVHTSMNKHPIAASTSQRPAASSLSTSIILDGGSNINVCNDPSRFTIETHVDESIMSGNAASRVLGHGTFLIYATFPRSDGTESVRRLTIRNAKLVPDFTTSVVSESYLEDLGIYRDPKTSILRRGKEVICKVKRAAGLYFLEDNRGADVKTAFTAQKSSEPRRPVRATAQQWHLKMGHVSPDTISHLSQNTVGATPIEGTGPKTVECEDCAVSKAKQIISRRSPQASTEPFSNVSYDMAFFEPAWNGESKLTHFHDQYTGFHVVYTHSTKDQTLQAIMDCAMLIKKQFGKDLMLLRRDNEGTLGKRFDRFISEEGILDAPSAPYTPSQNGDAERAGGVIITKARSMRVAARLPSSLWPEIIKAAAYLLNRTPIESKGWKTPYELIYGRKPDISHLKAYGCRAYALIHGIPKSNKLDPRAEIGYLLGYESTNIFRIWAPAINKIIRTRDVQFDETRFYSPDDINLKHVLKQQVDQVVELIQTPDFELSGVQIDIPDLLHEDEVTNDVAASSSHETEPQQTKAHDAVAEQRQIDSQLMTPRATKSPSPAPAIGTPSSLYNDEFTTSSSSPSLRPRSSFIPVRSNSPSIQPNLPVTPVPIPSTAPQTTQRPAPLTRRQPAARAHEISASLDEANVISSRTRNRRHNLSDQAHVTFDNYILSEELDDIQIALSTFVATDFKDQIREGRMHVSNVPVEPRNWREMLKHPLKDLYLSAAKAEVDKLMSMNTFEEVDDITVKDSNISPLPLMWVFKNKFDTNGYLEKVKARLCVRGDLQHTEEDTYAATLAIKTFRSLVAIAAVFDLEMKQYDAINAFANSWLDGEVVYSYKPEGFKDTPGKCYLLRRALYGLKRSALLWANELGNGLNKLGLRALPEFNGLYTNDRTIVFFYVDDIVVLIPRSYNAELLTFEKDLCSLYEMRCLGDLQWFLGIRIIRDRTQRKIWLCQDSYIKKICKRFDTKMEGKHPKMPLPETKLHTSTKATTGATEVQVPETLLHTSMKDSANTVKALYGQIIGSLNYAAVITRPDISKSVSELARHMSNPTAEHLKYAHHVLSYLAGTIHYAIEYGGDLANPFLLASDAAYADHGDRTSSQGFLAMMFGGPVDWKANKQQTVTTSSTEAELLAMSYAGKELIAWNRFFHQIQFDTEQPNLIHGDNRQTIRILESEAPRLTTKLRHVDVHQCWLRQMVQSGTIKVKWIATADMPADGLTKILTRQQHERFVAMLNLVDTQDLIERVTSY